MVKISVRKPTDHDISTLASTLRDSDRQELIAATYLSPYEAIRISVDNSDPEFCWAYSAKGVLLCIAGCTKTGNPWLLASPELRHYLYRLTKTAKASVRMMLKTYPTLTNMIDVRQTMTIRWLEILGFTLMDTLEIKPGYPLIRFQKVRDERNIKHTTGVTGL